MEMIIAALVGIGIGILIGSLIAKNKRQALLTQTEVLQAEIAHAQAQGETMVSAWQRQVEDVKASAREQVEQAKADGLHRLKEAKEEWDRAGREVLAAQEQRHQEAMTALQARFDETMQKVTAQVQTATDEMLRQRQKEFAEASHTNLGQIVNPLRETIDQMKKAMDENTLKQTSMSSEMRTHIEHIIQQSRAAQKSAEELTRAFKHGSKVQGDWGETVLDELLTSQGLTKGIHYDTQVVIRTDEGSLLRPDVILHLDQQREVIIDSKVSLTAFMDYVNADTDADRQRFLRAHIESIQKHVKELAAKDYSAYIQPPKVRMNYVIMFVPHTGALWTALNAQPDLWRKAMEKNVFIADEQTLYAALHIINLTWTQIAQAQNHEKVFALANEMIDRVGQFVRKYEEVGKALAKAQTAYEEGGRKLAPQGQSILTTAGKLIKLGAKQSDKNPILPTNN